MQEAQDQLLAGKYKNAEELEKGYLELQQNSATKKKKHQQKNHKLNRLKKLKSLVF